MRIAILLFLGLALCGCNKIPPHPFAKRPPAPWTDAILGYELEFGDGGGGSAMLVYQGSEVRGGTGGTSGIATVHLRITDILPTGVQLDVEIGANGPSGPFRTTTSLFVPYKGETTLPVTHNIKLRLNFNLH